jgi:CHAD domain-containing protein
MKPWTEIESKFLIPTTAVAERLEQCAEIGRASVGEASHLRFRDTYFDTGNRSLEAAGWTYRLRSCDEWNEACLKALDTKAAVKRRECFELRYAPGPADPALVPDELKRRVASLCAGAPLENIAVLYQERACLPLFKDSAKIAELDIDRLRVEKGSSASSLVIAEVELSALGSTSDLEDIASELESAYGLEPDARTKLDIALGPPAQARRAAPAESPAATLVSASANVADFIEARDETLREKPESPARTGRARSGMREFVARAMARLSIELEKRLRGLIAHGDPDDVHDLRLAARRSLAALEAFDEYLDHKEARRASKELRRLTRSFGRLRDTDIMLENAQAHLSKLSERRRPGFEPFVAELGSRCDTIRARLREKARGRGDLPDLGALVAPPRPDEALIIAADAAPALIFDAYARLKAEGARQFPILRSAEDLHTLRLAAKRLRYTLELFVPVLGPAASDCIAELRLLQDSLGDISDATVAILFLRQYLAEDSLSRGPEVASYLALRQREAERLLKSAQRPWSRVSGLAFRKKLLASIVQADGEEESSRHSRQ